MVIIMLMWDILKGSACEEFQFGASELETKVLLAIKKQTIYRLINRFYL